MEFMVVYLAAMLLPGALLVDMLQLQFHRVGLSVAVSVCVFVLALALARSTGLQVDGFDWLLVSCYTLTVASWLWTVHRRERSLFPKPSFDAVYLIPLAGLACVVAYALWAGPYTEVPSDAWWHIGRINNRLAAFHNGRIGSVYDIRSLVSKSEGYWYTTAAYFLGITHTGLRPAFGYLALANTLLFSAGVYSFALFVFRELVASRTLRHAVAAGTVFFFFTHFGLSVFSYVRYYVYAPTILSYVIYLSAVGCVLRFLQGAEPEYRLIPVAAVFCLVAGMLHVQEALFIVMMTGAIVLVECVRAWSSGGPWSDEEARRRTRLFLLSGIAGLAYAVLHASAYVFITRHSPLSRGRMIDINDYLPFLRNLYVLNPTKQFYQVLTVWGVLVYLLFFFNRGRFRQSPYLTAGAWLPALTVFNPVFCDLFLRFSWPEVLWRVCYALPLPFLGGYFLVDQARKGVVGPGLVRRTGGLAVAAALLLLLLPVRSTYFVSPYSKIYTLAPVRPGNDYRVWNDLLYFLDSRGGPRSVVTDPVTGYVINGLTDKRYRGYKFYGIGALKVDAHSYSAADFRFRKGWMVVVNRRDGASSATGRHGRHWPADIMKVSQRYSSAFLNFIRDNPGLFKEIWRRNRITVYRVEGG